MRFPLRSLASLVLAVGLATCGEGPNVPVKQTAGRGQFSLRPVWSPTAAAVYANRATFAAVDFDHVRIVLVRPPDQVVKDTTITFNASSPPATVEIFVDVRADGEVFNGRMEYTNNGVVVFRGEGRFASHPVDSPAPPAQDVVIAYVGPGANVSRIVVSPKTANIIAPATVAMTATAFDDAGAPVANVPLTWTSSDATVASVNANTGLVTAGARRGTATITAMTPTGRSDNGAVTVSLPPTGISVVSGGGQTGRAGTALAEPGVVRVTASDGIGVAGVTVNFAAPAGGAVGSASVQTNAEGLASTSLTLGGAIGPQSFAASAAGFSTSITATATAGEPSTIVVASGNGQRDTVRRALRAPFVVRVTDRFGNGVGGVNVAWARTSGSGTLGGATSVSNAEGLASMTYTLGGTVGAETVTATASGTTGSAIFTATAVSAAAANIAIVSGNAQSGRVTQALAAPFVVRVTDVDGNPVSAVPVNWTAVGGTIPPGTTTNAQGESSNTLTAGNAVGQATATATIGTGATASSVTFTANISAGVVARLAITVQPSHTPAGASITPGVRVELQDAAGNRTAAANPVTIALGANPGEATLGGTRTRTSSGGVAVFDDLTIDNVGTGYTLVVSSAGIPSATSTAFDVMPANMRMMWTDPESGDPYEGQPPTPHVTAGGSLTSGPVVFVADSTGQGLDAVPVAITITRGAQTVFSASRTTGEAGQLTFSSMQIPATVFQVAGTYGFSASVSGAIDSPLTLTIISDPGAPARYLMSAPTTTPATGSQTVITAALADQYNNPIPTATPNTVSWTLGGTGGGTLSPANSNTNSAGQAQSTYTAPGTANGSVIISAIDLQFSGVNGTITLTPQGAPAAPAMIGIVAAPESFVNGVVWTEQTVVRLVDNMSQPVALGGITVTLEILSGGQARPPAGSSVGASRSATRQRQRDVPVVNATAVTNSAGVATFSGVVATGTIEQIVLRFSATISGVGEIEGYYSGTEMHAGPAVNMQILEGENQVGQAGVALPVSPSIILVDVSGNPTIGPAASVSFTPASGSGAATPSPVSTDFEGVAQTTWTMPATSGPVTMVAAATIGGIARTVTFHATSATALPAFIEVLGSSVTTTPVETSLGASVVPAVRVLDDVEAPLPNMQVTFTAYGQCTIGTGSPLTVMTNASGEASVPVGSFSFDAGSAGSCRVTAQPQFGSLFGEMSYIATPLGTSTWTGQNSTDWTDAGNWAPLGVPGAGTSVYVPSYALRGPRLTANASVGNLTMEGRGGHEFNIFSNVLTVNGSLYGGPITALVSSTGLGAVVLNSTQEDTLSGFIGAPIRFGPDSPSCTGSYVLLGVVQTFSARVNCPLSFGNSTYSVAGSFVVQNQGRLTMNQPQSMLTTSSDVTFQGLSHDGFLTAGTIFVGATLNLVNAGSAIPFAQSTNATLIMGGSGTRSLNIGANVSTVNLGNLQFAPNNSVTVNSTSGSINVAGTFQTFGTMTLGATSSMTVAGATHFATSSSTNILGTMSLGASATTLFAAGSTVGGSGVLSVPNVAGCSRSATASVNVTGTPAYTAAVPSQCATALP